METALNAMWDAAPAAADRIAVVGAGVVGALVAYLCGRLPGAQVTLVDIEPSRAELARTLGVSFAAPGAAPGDCDLVVHASGTAAGLATALGLAGEEATVLELSWYGADEVAVPLGARFTAAASSSCPARSAGSRRRTAPAGRFRGGSLPRSICLGIRASTL